MMFDVSTERKALEERVKALEAGAKMFVPGKYYSMNSQIMVSGRIADVDTDSFFVKSSDTLILAADVLLSVAGLEKPLRLLNSYRRSRAGIRDEAARCLRELMARKEDVKAVYRVMTGGDKYVMAVDSKELLLVKPAGRVSGSVCGLVPVYNTK